jgi:hypothetical protein
MSTDLQTLSRIFRRFGERECVPASPLYGRLATGMAEDRELLRLASAARAGPVPNLFLAAVHYLLLKGAAHPLANHYVDLSEREQGGRPWSDPFPHFRAFCLEHAGAIRALIGTRLVQTNEVRRCACLLPAFEIVARRSGLPLALVEIGASAGLNLLWDRYRYDYGAGGQCGEPSSPVRLACELRGAGRPPLPAAMPRVAFRAGLDLHPLDLRDADQALWLRALIWPEQLDRAALLEAAVEVARREPPPLFAGDALDLLPGALARVPAGAALCVYHSFVLNQFAPAARDRFHAIVAEHARQRELYLVAIEWREPAPPVVLTTFDAGARADRHLANCDAHASWMEWLGA